MSDGPLTRRQRKKWRNHFAKKFLLKRLALLPEGQLTLLDGKDRYTFGEENTSLKATVTLHSPDVFATFLFKGSVGMVDDYINEQWDCDDVFTLTRIFNRNLAFTAAMEDHVYSQAATNMRRLLHFMKRNTLKKAKNNIQAHYDLGNDFFRGFLDPTMMYSCAIFPTPEATLEQASLHKLKVVCDKLQLTEKDHVIEIGSGWGALSCFAAKNYGCRVTTTTISKNQYLYVNDLIKQEGLADRVTCLFQDYRCLEGKFTKLVSIEMIEAVGYAYFKNYFAKCSALLSEDGMALIQAIQNRDNRFEAVKDKVDLIQQHIFPGGFLPSMASMLQTVARHTNMQLISYQDMTPHYVTTLLHWRDNLSRNANNLRACGYSSSLIRLWHYYLGHCAGCFAEDITLDGQLLFAKPRTRIAAM